MPRTPEDPPTEFARAAAIRLKELLEAQERSQAWLARQTDISDNYLSERFLLRKSFTLSDVESIAAALGVNPLEFLRSVGRQSDYAKAAFQAVEDDTEDEQQTV